MKVGGFGVEWIFIFLHRVSEEYMCGSGARPYALSVITVFSLSGWVAYSNFPEIGNLMGSTSVKNGISLYLIFISFQKICPPNCTDMSNVCQPTGVHLSTQYWGTLHFCGSSLCGYFVGYQPQVRSWSCFTTDI